MPAPSAGWCIEHYLIRSQFNRRATTVCLVDAMQRKFTELVQLGTG